MKMKVIVSCLREKQVITAILLQIPVQEYLVLKSPLTKKNNVKGNKRVAEENEHHSEENSKASVSLIIYYNIFTLVLCFHHHMTQEQNEANTVFLL